MPTEQHKQIEIYTEYVCQFITERNKRYRFIVALFDIPHGQSDYSFQSEEAALKAGKKWARCFVTSHYSEWGMEAGQ